MEAFYLVAFLQRYLPLCPRLSLNPRDSELISKPARRGSQKTAAS
jgi:hypothetical protein